MSDIDTVTRRALRAAMYKPKKIQMPEKGDSNVSFSETCGMIYTSPGVGKTTLLTALSEDLNILILDCDKGGTYGKNVARISINTWEKLNDAVYSIPIGKYDIVAIDTIDNVMMLLRTYIQDTVNIITPFQVPNGTGWDFENSLFTWLFSLVSSKNSHTLFMGHSSLIEEEINVNGKKTTVQIVTPSIRGKIFQKIAGNCMYVLYIAITQEGNRRINSKRRKTMLVKDRTGLFEDGTTLTIEGEPLKTIFKTEFAKGKV